MYNDSKRNAKQRESRRLKKEVAAEIAAFQVSSSVSFASTTGSIASRNFCDFEGGRKVSEPSTSHSPSQSPSLSTSKSHLTPTSTSHNNDSQLINNSDINQCHQVFAKFTASEEVSDDIFLENNTSSESEAPDLRKFLRTWAIDHHINHTAITALLKGLQRECCYNCAESLPLDARTLLQTKRSVHSQIQSLAGGEYVHMGIQNGIESRVKFSTDKSNTLKVIVNIDGLPIHKSSGLQFWPILLRVVNGNFNTPFVVGLFSGMKKPSNVSEFLHQFIADMAFVIENGVTLEQVHFRVSLHCIICDAPALAMLKCTKGHTGYFSCHRCIQEGSQVSHTTVFLQTDAPPRTNEGFRAHQYANDMDGHQTGISALVSLPIDMVQDLPFDYMHLVCLGVCKRLINHWISGSKLSARLPSRLIEDISTRLVSLRSSIPVEFCRKPRCLGDIPRWKATEFRLFLLYTGIVVLSDIFQEYHPTLYQNFLLLQTAIFIMCSPSLIVNDDTLRFAHDCLVNFVKTAIDIYGASMVVYNVHSLIHLKDDVSRFGCLDSYSCFPFENHMSTIKRYVRSPNNPLAQVVGRLNEENFDGYERLPKKCTRDHLLVRNCRVKTTSPDNCIRLQDGRVCLVIDWKRHGNYLLLQCKVFQTCRPYYTYPCSSLDLGIAEVCNLDTKVVSVHQTNVSEKLVLLPNHDRTTFVAIPFCHSDDS